jgi:hypothetical protein
MVYRVVNQLIDIPSSPILVPTNSLRGNNISFIVPYARNLAYQKSFPDGIRIWNALPSEAVCATSMDSFKVQIQNTTIKR